MKRRNRDEFQNETQRLLADPDRSPEALERFKAAIASLPLEQQAWMLEAWGTSTSLNPKE